MGTTFKLIIVILIITHGPLARYVKLWVAHAPGMPGTLSPSPWVSDPDMHHGTCVTHVPWCMPGSLASSFLWNRWLGKRSRHSRRMRNPQFYVSGKRPMASEIQLRALCNMGYPSETHLKLKSYDISFVHNIRSNRPIVLKLCTRQGSNTVMLCVNVRNDWPAGK